MFTQAELNALTTALSNAARVLYCVAFRPHANTDTLLTQPLQYKELLALVNGDNSQPIFTRGRQINSLIEELALAGLVTVPKTLNLDASLAGEQLLLPLIKNNQHALPLHQQHYAMHRDWQPDKAVFEDIATLIGLIDKSYDEHNVGEFVAYWLGRPESVLSSYQWTQKFTYSIKNRRTATGYQAVKKVGSQNVVIEPGIEADDNARQLVAKYAHKPQSK
ncbi:MAG: flavodoxin [Alteromonadaceae bacterium]|nr:flavodoxin [Alteromonadaceae bacterium]